MYLSFCGVFEVLCSKELWVNRPLSVCWMTWMIRSHAAGYGVHCIFMMSCHVTLPTEFKMTACGPGLAHQGMLNGPRRYWDDKYKCSQDIQFCFSMSCFHLICFLLLMDYIFSKTSDHWAPVIKIVILHEILLNTPALCCGRLCKQVNDPNCFLFWTVHRGSHLEWHLHIVLLSNQDIFGLVCCFLFMIC